MSISTQHYANLSEDSYRLNHRVGYHPPGDRDKVEFDGVVYEVIEFVDNKKTGYQGVIYQRADTGEIVVAHRGTEFDREPLKDGLRADGGMVANDVNAQAIDAIQLTKRALSYARDEALDAGVKVPEVTVTGHSLGGCLAQITAHHFDLKGETFNAYGAAGLKGINPNEPNAANVTNHVMAGDFVSAASPHYGKVINYATPKEMDWLSRAGYGSRVFNDLSVVVPLVGSHLMRNFLDDPATPSRNESALSSPEPRNRAQANADMIQEYRHEVHDLRVAGGEKMRQVGKMWNDGLDRINRNIEWVGQKADQVAESTKSGVRQGAEWVGEKADQGIDSAKRGAKRVKDGVEDGIDWAGEKAEQASDSAKRGAKDVKEAAVDAWNWLDKTAGQALEQVGRSQQTFDSAGKKINDWIFNRPSSAIDVDRAMDGVRPYLPAKDADLKDTIRGSADMVDTQASAAPQAGGQRATAPTLESDPSAFLDRMLAAAKSGDSDAFRQMTQQAADGEGGRTLREQAIAGVDRQEQLAREQAERSAMEELAARHARQSGPVMS